MKSRISALGLALAMVLLSGVLCLASAVKMSFTGSLNSDDSNGVLSSALGTKVIGSFGYNTEAWQVVGSSTPTDYLADSFNYVTSEGIAFVSSFPTILMGIGNDVISICPGMLMD